MNTSYLRVVIIFLRFLSMKLMLVSFVCKVARDVIESSIHPSVLPVFFTGNNRRYWILPEDHGSWSLHL